MPPTGGNASDGSCEAAWTIWLSSPLPAVPAVRVGMSRRHRPSAAFVPESQRVVGSKPMIVTAPAPYARSAATVSSPTLASGRPTASLPECRDVGGAFEDLAEEGHQRRRGGIGRRGRSIGEDVVRERREARRPGRPTGDHQTTATGDPAAQRDELLRRELIQIDVLPDQPIERAPCLDAIWQIAGLEADSQRSHVVHVRQQIEVADDVAGSFGDDADDHLRAVVDRVVRLGRRDGGRPVDETDLDRAPEARRLDVQAVRLVRLGGCLDRRPEAGPSWVPPVSRSSPVSGGPSFLRWTSMAIQAPTLAWPSSRTTASSVRPGGGDGGRRSGAHRRRRGGKVASSANATAMRTSRAADETLEDR